MPKSRFGVCTHIRKHVHAYSSMHTHPQYKKCKNHIIADCKEQRYSM